MNKPTAAQPAAYSDETVQAMTDAVWGSLLDDQLRALTRHEFGACVAGFSPTAEELEDAWEEFGERRSRAGL